MKKTVSLKKLLLCFVLMAGVAGCKASVDGGSGNPSPVVNPLEDKVAGPNIEGSWQSSCRENYGANQYEITSMTIVGQSVERKVAAYTDTGCSISTTVKNWKGAFHYVAKYGADVFEVEYLINLGNGATQFTGENIKLDQNKLWISEYYIGESVTPTLPLTKITTAIEN